MAVDVNGKTISVGAKVTVKATGTKTAGAKTTEHVVKSISGDTLTVECCDSGTVSTVQANECTCCK